MSEEQKQPTDEQPASTPEVTPNEQPPVVDPVPTPDPVPDPVPDPALLGEMLGDAKVQLLGEGAPPVSEDSPLLQQAEPLESYPVDSDIWGPVNAAFCELCKRYGLPKGHQDVVFDRKTGSFVILERPAE